MILRLVLTGIAFCLFACGGKAFGMITIGVQQSALHFGKDVNRAIKQTGQSGIEDIKGNDISAFRMF